ncbi:MAG: phenylalanine--tRNA ligase subunit beta [Acidimicrobiales bacterium]
MKVLLSWLREFTPVAADADPEAIGHRLSMLGLAVESMDRMGGGGGVGAPPGQGDLEGIVVARVLDLRPHPNADKIQVVDVDPGDGGPLQICCGAFNMAVGDLVPLATLGTVMPGGMAIARRKLRGEWSNGMLCSPPELGLPGDGRGILVLPDSIATPGTPLTDALGLVPDVVYDLEVNPNRPDAMAVAGVARDLAADLGLPFSLPTPPPLPPAADPAPASVEVLDPDRCGRFTATVLRGVRVGPSPAWLAGRLTALGMRPINNVVDVSNYVMLELGQPSHPYDLAALPGGALRVRRARAGETLITIDNVERHAGEDDLLICDGDDVAIGFAGVMGGAGAEITDATTDVVVEMAWFQPLAVATTARRLGLRTEASARFEKGCDPEVIELAVARFVELLGDAVGSVDGATVDVRGELHERPPVRLRTARVNRLLGTALTATDVLALLEPIGFTCSLVGEDHDVRIPSWRPDCEVEVDLVEEVARRHGYDRIGAVVPPAVRFGALTPRQHARRTARRVMVGLGLAEALPLPFLAPGDLERAGLGEGDGAGTVITITNPLVADQSVLRTSLLPGLLQAVAANEHHRLLGTGLFEIGHVFRRPSDPAADLPEERELLAVALAGAEAPVAVEAGHALATAVGHTAIALRAAEVPGLHPTRAAELVLDDVVVGTVGEIDPGVLDAHGIEQRVGWLEVDLGHLLDTAPVARPYRPFSRYPSSDIDLAFEVDDAVPAAAVLATATTAGAPLLVAAELFDAYRGDGVADGRRSLAVRLRFQAPDRTLTDAEVGHARRGVIDAVEAAHAAQLRG